MAIYNIFDSYDNTEEYNHNFNKHKPNLNIRDRFFSAIGVRILFLVLLFVDILWGIYSFCVLCCTIFMFFLTCGFYRYFKYKIYSSLLSIKRSLVSSLALVIAMFSPALGIMFLCMYFFIYDKDGVKEMVPSILKDQFKDIFDFD